MIQASSCNSVEVKLATSSFGTPCDVGLRGTPWRPQETREMPENVAVPDLYVHPCSGALSQLMGIAEEALELTVQKIWELNLSTDLWLSCGIKMGVKQPLLGVRLPLYTSVCTLLLYER